MYCFIRKHCFNATFHSTHTVAVFSLFTRIIFHPASLSALIRFGSCELLGQETFRSCKFFGIANFSVLRTSQFCKLFGPPNFLALQIFLYCKFYRSASFWCLLTFRSGNFSILQTFRPANLLPAKYSVMLSFRTFKLFEAYIVVLKNRNKNLVTFNSAYTAIRC
jgi:hypothetical protein